MPQSLNAPLGYFGAITGAMIWGIGPYFFRQLDAFPVAEIITMRIIVASLLLCVFFGVFQRSRLAEFRTITIKQYMLFFICAWLVLGNWYVFVFAVSVERIVEAALGYYIYPLVAACLGMLVLGEKTETRTVIALCLAMMAVLIKASLLPNFPWIAIALASTFGIYAILRKRISVATDTGTCVETVMLLPLGLCYMGWQISVSAPLIFGGGGFGFSMALLCGLFTTVPLLLFHLGNRNLPMAVSGLLFYVNPSLQLSVGIFFGEAFTRIDLVVFALIWTGLAIQFMPVLLRRA